jgi:hypothetical protein
MVRLTTFDPSVGSRPIMIAFAWKGGPEAPCCPVAAKEWGPCEPQMAPISRTSVHFLCQPLFTRTGSSGRFA